MVPSCTPPPSKEIDNWVEEAITGVRFLFNRGVLFLEREIINPCF